MDINAYLNFNGRCAEAFRFYERCFGGTITMMQTHGETPARDFVPADWHDKVMHVAMTVGNQTLMGSDAPPDRYVAPQGIFVAIHAPTSADGERIFKELAEGGQITMPFDKTFWSAGFGMVVDRFGIPWMVNSAAAPELA